MRRYMNDRSGRLEWSWGIASRLHATRVNGRLAHLPRGQRRSEQGPSYFLLAKSSNFCAALEPSQSRSQTMGAMKRKADQRNAAPTKEKPSSGTRPAKRRKSDAAEQPPAKTAIESSAPKSVFKSSEEKSFPRGGASVLTPLEHKQISIQATQDVLFEQSGQKRTGGDDEFGDMGSEDGEKAAPKSSKKKTPKKGKKAAGDEEAEASVRAEGLSYKVRRRERFL